VLELPARDWVMEGEMLPLPPETGYTLKSGAATKLACTVHAELKGAVLKTLPFRKPPQPETLPIRKPVLGVTVRDMELPAAPEVLEGKMVPFEPAVADTCNWFGLKVTCVALIDSKFWLATVTEVGRYPVAEICALQLERPEVPW